MLTVFQPEVGIAPWILKLSASRSAAVHHCHLFHVSFSAFSAPSLSSLASLSLSDVCPLGERLLGNDCSHFSARLSIHSLHLSSDSWPGSRLISGFLCPVLPALLKHHRSSSCCLAQAAYRCHRQTSSYVQYVFLLKVRKAALIRPWL